MIKPTKTNLTKIENILKEIDYTILYEKGSFKSGYCIVEDRRVIVINRFFQIEARINTLMDIIASLDIDTTQLTANTLKAYMLVSNQIKEALD